MSVLVETTLGNFVVDLEVEKCPRAAENLLKLCKAKRLNCSLFDVVQKGHVAQAGGDFRGEGAATGGSSIWGVLEGDGRRFFEPEFHPTLRHSGEGVVSMATVALPSGRRVCGSRFFVTTAAGRLPALDGQHAIVGHVAEGLETVRAIDRVLVDESDRPLEDVRILHTYVLDDPFPDPAGLEVPSRSPSPTPSVLADARMPASSVAEAGPDDASREAAARSLTLEMVGDLPFAEAKPPENVLFVCRLNPVTRSEDLRLIFSSFGPIGSCEIVRDRLSGDSLQYAFVEFENKEDCERAYAKMDNVLIDDRRIHVDFSQSVAKLHSAFLADRRGSGEARALGSHRGRPINRHSRSRSPEAPSHSLHSFSRRLTGRSTGRYTRR